MLRWIVLSLLLFCLTSCGFQPRGPMTLSPPLQHLYLKASDPYGLVARNLREYLKMSGVHLSDTPTTDANVLDIIKEETGQQLVSMSGTQQTMQYTLFLRVTFQITKANGEVLILPQTVSEARTITIQSNQILGGSNEASGLYQQMRENIVYDIMNRLASRDFTAILTKKQP